MQMPTTTPITRAVAILPLLMLLQAKAGESFVTDEAQRQRIEEALPAEAAAKPAKPRHLLIFNRNLEYNGHRSAILAASEAFTQMGRKTGAFVATVSEDPAVFDRESLRQFDAVFLNNSIGACVVEPERRRNLLEFVTGGGGLMGVHGTSIAFMHWKWPPVEDWPEFGNLIGARGAAHPHANERVFIGNRRTDPSPQPGVRRKWL